MYIGLLHLHSFLRWVIIVLAVVVIYKSYTGMKSGRPFTSGDKKTGLFLMIAAHTELLIGLYQWFTGQWGLKRIQEVGMKEVMHNGVFRFFAIEHITGMIIAIALITVGRGVSKKNLPDAVKHTKTFWFILIALVIILASVPWPFREAGRPWF